MNNQNLKSMKDFPPEYRREMGRRGGKNSGKTRRELKAARELMRELWAMPLDTDAEDQRAAADWLNSQGMPANEQNQLYAAIVTLHRRALAGDVRAFEDALKIGGEWPADKAEITTEEKDPMMNQKVYCVTPSGEKFIRFYGDGVVYELPDNGRDKGEEWEPIEQAIKIMKKNGAPDKMPDGRKTGFGKTES